MQTINWKGHGAMFGANAIWGLMSPVAKFVMLGGIVTPLAVTDLRIVGAMILFWILSFFRKSEHVPPKDLAKLFGASLLGVVLNQGSFILGVGMTSPVNASIITTSMPLWAMILAAIFLKEPITAKKVLGIAAGASGALLLVLGSGNTDSAGGHSVAGDLLVLFAQLSYALYFVLYKNFVTRYSLTTIMKWMFTFATLCILPFTGRDLLSTDWQALSAAAIGSLAFIVVGSTFLSYMLIIVGQKNLRPTVAGMYNYIQPLVATLVAVCWGMETFDPTKICSVLLIFSGFYLVTTSRSRADAEKSRLQPESPRKRQ